MCGRYYISDEMQNELEKLVQKLDQRMKKAELNRDVYPSNQAPIITYDNNGFAAQLCSWGYHTSYSKNLIINARAETILEKSMFLASIESNRCIIPAAGFYEWDKTKNKYTFTAINRQPIFMAGLYRKEENDNHFVILTTDANESMKPVHDRMPLLLEKEKAFDWLIRKAEVQALLRHIPERLEKHTENEQMRLEFI